MTVQELIKALQNLPSESVTYPEEYSPEDPCRPVTPGEPYTILHGNIIAVGHDPETGEARPMTDGEEQEVRDYFHRVSRPGSGVMAVLAIRAGR